MPGTLTGTATYSNTATSPTDGDVQTAASVNTPLQTVLNNTRYLQQILESTGATKIKQVADAATLAALVSIADGDVVIQDDENALYRRNTSGTGATSGSFYIDHATEAGGWDLIRPENSLYGAASVTAVADRSQATSTHTAVSGSSLSVTGGRSGDTVLLTAMVVVNPNSDEVYLKAKVTDATPTVNDLSTQVARCQGTQIQTVTYFARYDLTVAGTVTAELFFANGDNATNVTVGVKYFRMEIIRP